LPLHFVKELILAKFSRSEHANGVALGSESVFVSVARNRLYAKDPEVNSLSQFKSCFFCKCVYKASKTSVNVATNVILLSEFSYLANGVVIPKRVLWPRSYNTNRV
jgi:hypothetical protein